MRKVFSILAILSVLAVSASADILGFRPYAGYTTVNMGDVNADIANFSGAIEALSTISSGSYKQDENTPLSNGMVLGIDISSGRVLPWQALKLAWRNEFLQTNQASYKVNAVVGSNPFDYQVTEQGTLSSSLVGLVWSPFPSDEGLNFSLGSYFGVGYGTFARTQAGGNGNQLGALYTRLGAEAQFEAQLNWQVAQHWSLGLSSAFRWADLGVMEDGNGKFMHNLLSDESPSLPRNDVGVDFSGFTGTGALSYSF